MEKTFIPKIRKISLGENPISEKGNTLTLSLGQKMYYQQKYFGTISEIVIDESAFYFFGNIRYCVYVRKENNEEVLYKMFERVPVAIECIIE